MQILEGGPPITETQADRLYHLYFTEDRNSRYYASGSTGSRRYSGNHQKILALRLLQVHNPLTSTAALKDIVDSADAEGLRAICSSQGFTKPPERRAKSEAVNTAAVKDILRATKVYLRKYCSYLLLMAALKPHQSYIACVLFRQQGAAQPTQVPDNTSEAIYSAKTHRATPLRSHRCHCGLHHNRDSQNHLPVQGKFEACADIDTA